MSIDLNIISLFIGIAVSIISFFTVRTLRQVDANQKELYDHMLNHESRLSSLEGEHRAFTKTDGHKE